MPAHAKLATALAMSLALVGAGTSLAQSTSAPGTHAVYVSIVEVEAAAGPEELTGKVSCDVPLHERLVRRTIGRQVCMTDDYAYAYPSDEPAPWRSGIEEVDQSMYVDQTGAMWQVAEISYRSIAHATEGGPQLVKAMAAEILPQDGGEELSYAMPLNENLLEQTEDDITVDVGPSPQEAHRNGISSPSLPTS